MLSVVRRTFSSTMKNPQISLKYFRNDSREVRIPIPMYSFSDCGFIVSDDFKVMKWNIWIIWNTKQNFSKKLKEKYLHWVYFHWNLSFYCRHFLLWYCKIQKNSDFRMCWLIQWRTMQNFEEFDEVVTFKKYN